MSFPPSTPQQPGQQPAAPQHPQQPQFGQPLPQQQTPQAPQPPSFAQPQGSQQQMQTGGAPVTQQQVHQQQQTQVPPFQVQAPVNRSALPTTLAQTNTYALVSIILVFLAPIAGIIFGHLGLGQIKRNNDAGRGLALTAVILGYIYVAFILLFIIFYVSMIGLILASAGAAMGDLGSYDSF